MDKLGELLCVLKAEALRDPPNIAAAIMRTAAAGAPRAAAGGVAEASIEDVPDESLQGLRWLQGEGQLVLWRPVEREREREREREGEREMKR